jgi:hypothetical protein
MPKQDQVIEGSYPWTREEIARSGMWHFRASNRWMGRWLSIILIIVGGARLVLAILNHESITIEIGFIIVILLIALLSLSIPVLMRAIISVNFSHHPELGKQVHLQITVKEIKIEMEGSPATVFKWKDLTKVVHTRDGLLCYSGDMQYHWLPFKAFEDTAAADLLSFADQYPEKMKEVR